MVLDLPLALACSLLAALLGLGVAWASRRLRLLQAPNARSSHAVPTSNLGGLAIVGAALLSLGWAGADGTVAQLAWWGLPLFAVGVLDDLRGLSIRVRLAVQAGSVLALGLLLAPPGGWPLPAGPLQALALAGAALVLGMAGIWWINLFNFMDGTDGLAAAQAVFIALAGALLDRGGADPLGLGLFATALLGAAFGFLLINRPPARLFMGDSGSTWLAWGLLALAWGRSSSAADAAVWAILAAAFVTDATVTLLTRMLTGQPWRQGHRSHGYQLVAASCADRRAGHRRALGLLLALNLLGLLPLAWACRVWPAAWPLALALAYGPLAWAAWRHGVGRPAAPPPAA